MKPNWFLHRILVYIHRFYPVSNDITSSVRPAEFSGMDECQSAGDPVETLSPRTMTRHPEARSISLKWMDAATNLCAVFYSWSRDFQGTFSCHIGDPCHQRRDLGCSHHFSSTRYSRDSSILSISFQIAMSDVL